jgi:hypothetical protein
MGQWAWQTHQLRNLDKATLGDYLPQAILEDFHHHKGHHVSPERAHAAIDVSGLEHIHLKQHLERQDLNLAIQQSMR